MVGTQDLNVVWSLVGAHFICLEEIDLLGFLRHVEVPLTECVILEAVHWLISLHSQLGWIQVVD